MFENISNDILPRISSSSTTPTSKKNTQQHIFQYVSHIFLYNYIYIKKCSANIQYSKFPMAYYLPSSTNIISLEELYLQSKLSFKSLHIFNHNHTKLEFMLPIAHLPTTALSTHYIICPLQPNKHDLDSCSIQFPHELSV